MIRQLSLISSKLRRRLSLYGFETLGSLVADFLTGKFPVITEDLLRKLNKLNEADILAGHAKSFSARHYALYELDRITGTYIQGWERLAERF